MLTYNKFKCLSTKARICWVQERLISLGYLQPNESSPAKRDKPYIQALKKFQTSNGFTTNAEIHPEEFDILNAVTL